MNNWNTGSLAPFSRLSESKGARIGMLIHFIYIEYKYSEHMLLEKTVRKRLSVFRSQETWIQVIVLSKCLALGMPPYVTSLDLRELICRMTRPTLPGCSEDHMNCLESP